MNICLKNHALLFLDHARDNPVPSLGYGANTPEERQHNNFGLRFGKMINE